MDETDDKQILGADAAGSVRLRGRFTEETWAEAESAYMGGATAAEVGRRLGMSPQTLYVHMAGRGKRAERLKLLREKRLAAGKERVAPSAEALALMMARELNGLGERLIEASGLREAAREREDGTPVLRRRHSKELWTAARRDYEAGGFTAGRVAERYGMVESTIRSRAVRERWCKTASEAVLPLKPADDPKQITGDGGSAWLKIAHRAQLPPEGNWRTWLFQGGRGAGKTRAGAEWLADLAERTPHGIFALVAPTEHDVREVMIGGPSGLLSLPGRMPCYYEPSRRRVSWKHNSAIAYAFSAEEPERLRGPQFMGAWADEFAIWPKPEHTLAMLRMGLRLGTDPRLVLTTTPKPILSLRKLHTEASCAVTLAPTSANAKHLHEGFLAGLEEIYGGTKLAQQELMGELVAGDGALWTEEMIAGAKARWAGQAAERVVVGVDPPASLSGVCGIVVAGRIGRTGVVLEDASAVGLSPNGWALRVKAAAERWGARKIIAEANQGGDMVRSTLAASGVGCAIQLVHAKDGKRTRAEPVAALYEQKRVAHRADFPALEEEMMALGAAEPEGRLDRADALVWALTSLLVEKLPPPPRIIDLWNR